MTSLVCGVIQHRRRNPLDKAAWSWPFGRVELRADELRAYAPVFLGRFELRIPYGDIVRATAKPLRWGGRIRMTRRDGSGDVTIVTVNAGYLDVRDVLRGRGVDVQDA
jgi:hypothetical protein